MEASKACSGRGVQKEPARVQEVVRAPDGGPPGPVQRRDGVRQTAAPVRRLLAHEDEGLPEAHPQERHVGQKARRHEAQVGEPAQPKLLAAAQPLVAQGDEQQYPGVPSGRREGAQGAREQEVAPDEGGPDRARREGEKERLGVQGVEEEGGREERHRERRGPRGPLVVDLLGYPVDEEEAGKAADERERDPHPLDPPGQSVSSQAHEQGIEGEEHGARRGVWPGVAPLRDLGVPGPVPIGPVAKGKRGVPQLVRRLSIGQEGHGQPAGHEEDEPRDAEDREDERPRAGPLLDVGRGHRKGHGEGPGDAREG